jgi:hypothetical protein
LGAFVDDNGEFIDGVRSCGGRDEGVVLIFVDDRGVVGRVVRTGIGEGRETTL